MVQLKQPNGITPKFAAKYIVSELLKPIDHLS